MEPVVDSTTFGIYRDDELATRLLIATFAGENTHPPRKRGEKCRSQQIVTGPREGQAWQNPRLTRGGSAVVSEPPETCVSFAERSQLEPRNGSTKSGHTFVATLAQRPPTSPRTSRRLQRIAAIGVKKAGTENAAYRYS